MRHRRQRFAEDANANETLKQWLIRHRNVYITEEDGKEAATYLLYGKYHRGKLNIPQDLETEFRDRYASEILSPAQAHCTQWSISEQKTPVFRFFCDFDLKCRREISEDVIDDCMHLVKEVVKEFFTCDDDDTLFDMLVCRPPNPVTLLEKCKVEPDVDEKGFRVVSTFQKYGIHPIFHNLFVNAHQALDIRAAMVYRFQQQSSNFMPERVNDWEDVIDECVYTRNGLRMIGSAKFRKCICRRKSPGICPLCRGEIDVVDLPYYVSDLLSDKYPNFEEHPDWSSFMNRLRTNYHVAVRLTSIRCPAGTSATAGWAVPPYYRSLPGGRKLGQSRIVTLPDGRTKERMWKDDATTFQRKRNKVLLPYDDRRMDILRDILKTSVSLEHREVQIHRVFTNERNTYYVLNVRGPGSQYCYNLGQEHRSNTVYFYLTCKGICQKCHCHCKTTEGRVSGKMCSDFESPYRNVGRNYLRDLFPTLTQPVDRFKSYSQCRLRFFNSLQSPNSRARLMNEIAHKLRSQVKKYDKERSGSSRSYASDNDEEEKPSRKRKPSRSPQHQSRKKFSVRNYLDLNAVET